MARAWREIGRFGLVALATFAGLWASATAGEPSQLAKQDIAALSELLQTLGMPGVLVYAGWWLGKHGLPITVTVRLSDADRSIISDALRQVKE